MNRNSFLLLMVLGLSLTVLAQTLPAQAPAGQAPAAAPEQQKKQITNPDEYNAYVAALNESTPAKKIELLDAFLAKYPSTVVKEDALELKMVAELQAGRNPDATARQLIEVNPDSLRALIILSNVFVQTPLSETDPQLQQKLADAEKTAQRGLQVLPAFNPPNVKPEELKKNKEAAESTFRQALGMVGLARKQYEAAENEFRRAAEISPDDASIFYRLGNAYISERPAPKYTPAFWAFARTVMLEGPGALPPAARQQVDAYLRDQLYVKYHGSVEGLDALKQQAKNQPFPPPDFKVLSKAEVEAALPPDPARMSFDQIAKTLAAGGPRGDELWGKMKGQPLKLGGKVVSVTPAKASRTVRFAVVLETQQKPDAFDVELTLANPLAGRLPVGVDSQFVGMANSFKPDPFVLVLVDGKVVSGVEAEPVKKAPPAKKGPAKKAPARKG